MTLIFCFGFLNFVALAKMQFRRTCLIESINLQKKIISVEKTLFTLNSLSTTLQIQYDLKIIQAAATILIPPKAAQLYAEAMAIRARQFQLDQVQRGLIKAGQLMVAAETARIERQMLNESLKFNRLWSFFLSTFFNIRPTQVPRVSVRALTSGLAPNYELEQNYKQQQKVAFLWQLKYLTKSLSQTLIKSENSFELNCEARPLKKEGSWSVEI